MKNAAYNQKIHHRRSIRLKGHDYVGPGLYFVTICAHREFIEWAKGNPFGVMGATCVSPVREIIADEWRRCGKLRDDAFPGEFVVMPDHFHALIRIEKGQSELGHVIGAFKAAVSRRIRRRRGDTHVAQDTHVAPGTHVAPFGAPPENIRIWHRNYYEMIVRTPEAERNIREYIRANPWKLVQHATHEGQSFRMIGNPALLNREKIAMLCSRNCPPDVLAAATKHARTASSQHCFISGFHSPPEKAILATLLRTGDTHVALSSSRDTHVALSPSHDTHAAPKLICCPAWGINEMRIPPEWLPALEANRMLILEMRNREGNLAAAEARNRFVLDSAEKRWLPHVTPGGMLDRLARKGDTHVARRAREKEVVR